MSQQHVQDLIFQDIRPHQSRQNLKKKAAVLGVRPFGIIPTEVLAGQRLGVELALLEDFVQRRIHEHPLHARRLLLASSGKVSQNIYGLDGTSLSEELLRKQDFLSERSVAQQGIPQSHQDFEEGLRHCLPGCHRQVGRQDLEKLLSRQLGLGSRFVIQLEGHYLKDALHRAVVHGLVAGPNILPLLGRFPEQIQPGLEAAIDRGRQPCPSPFLRWQLNAWLVMYWGQDSDGAGLLELVLLQVPRCGQDEGVMVLLRTDPLHLPIFLVHKQVIHCHHQIYRLGLLVRGAHDPLYAALVH